MNVGGGGGSWCGIWVYMQNLAQHLVALVITKSLELSLEDNFSEGCPLSIYSLP